LRRKRRRSMRGRNRRRMRRRRSMRGKRSMRGRRRRRRSPHLAYCTESSLPSYLRPSSPSIASSASCLGNINGQIINLLERKFRRKSKDLFPHLLKYLTKPKPLDSLVR